ncbi:MAG: 2-C-methyl-D-erythritol 4-phosphate cytidylyltransferase [Lachnospiraceae bacterium]|nr:2-C-methyl-D-erythritol 4-phosphate cytidylyltransferase [Lachnospiraceae bacterium]
MKEKCTAIVLAAGVGKRMQSNVAKQYMILGDKPVIWYALQTFEQNERITDVILVVGKGEIPYGRSEIVEKYGFQKVISVVEGGAERYLSVWNGLQAMRKTGQIADYVFIHDGARPFLNEQMIEETYREVTEYGACVVGMPVKDTIKVADEEGIAVKTPERKSLWAVQTPQVFRGELILEAYKTLIDRLEHKKVGPVFTVTDDAMVVETMLQHPVKLVTGSYENIKITTPEDMLMAEAILKKSKK